MYPPRGAGGDVCRCGVSFGIVRKGLGDGEVKFAINFLDCKCTRSFSADVVERSSMKHSLHNISVIVGVYGEGTPWIFRLLCVRRR